MADGQKQSRQRPELAADATHVGGRVPRMKSCVACGTSGPGLDEVAIKSIALTRYQEGAGMLGVADCSVCFMEFLDALQEGVYVPTATIYADGKLSGPSA